MIKNPTLFKVFLALRPNFFEGVHTEHITLKYFNQIKWDELLNQAAKFDRQLPATIHFKEYGVWYPFDDTSKSRCFGAHVITEDSNILNHLQMPHISLTKEQWYYKPLAINVEPVQVVDTLWIGKKINGALVWAKVNNKQIGLENNVVNIPGYGFLPQL